MKNITLKNLSIQNFKGIKSFTLTPDGKDFSIYGTNATGKTTLKDSVAWLLTGKDSNNRADFQLKPVDKNGKERPKLEIIVEAVFLVDKKPLALKKRYYEKWVKTRGKANKEFSGHKTDHFIDEVPAQKKDYEKKIAEILDIDALPLLTDIQAFNNLHWEKRRDILLSICGDITDAEIILSDKKFASLKEIIKDSSISDYKKKLRVQQKDINDELETIPIRISENQDNIAEVEKPDQKIKDRIQETINGLSKQISEINSNEAVSKKQIRVNEIDGEIIALNNKYEKDVAEKEKKAVIALNEALGTTAIDKAKLEASIKNNKTDIKDAKKKVDLIEEGCSAKREEWKKINNEKVIVKKICPCCYQNFPEDQIESVREEANNIKAETLKKITEDGKASRITQAEFVEHIKTMEAAVKKDSAFLEEINDKRAAIKKQLSQAETVAVNKPDLTKLEKEKAGLEKDIKVLNSGDNSEREVVDEKIKECNTMIEEFNNSMANWQASQKAIDRVITLEKQEKTLAKTYEEIEEKLNMIDQFIIKKVELSEEKLNSHFKLAKFKLFDLQINGGVKECCRTLYDGVPFNRGLNNGSKVNVGLDIIETLSQYYLFKMPVFIDNAESCTNIAKTSFQLLKLVVDKAAKKLTVK